MDKRHKILIAEDESIIAIDLQWRLEQNGFEVVGVVSSGDAVVEKALETKPDLILMDILLEGDMDGVSAMEVIGASIDVSVIYLTSYSDQKTLQRAKITEPSGYILKPFGDRELLATIEMALHKYALEQKLKGSERWLNTTLKAISDGVISTDIHDDITFMNPVAESLTGRKLDDVRNSKVTALLEIYEANSSEPVKLDLTAIAKNKDSPSPRACVLHSRAKENILIQLSASPIHDDTRGIVGTVLVIRDISRQKKIEDELLRAQKLDSLAVLAGGIAHDFNNLLTGILGNINLISSEISEDDDLYRMLMEAENASMRAKTLTHQLLTFAKGGAPVKTTGLISEVISEATTFALRGTKFECSFDFDRDLCPVDFDEGQMYQVIYNLVINAVQAKPRDNKIGVSAANIASLPSHITHEQTADSFVKIRISDTGAGIDSKHESKIFDPYFTTKKAGSGLGLATAYSVIKKHGGYITVDSNVNVGTSFFIFMPASKTEYCPKPGKDHSLHEGYGKILMMDDD